MNGIRVALVERLDLRFASRPWPFALERRDAIDAYFATLKRRMPELWNGRVLLLHQWAIAERTFSGTFLATDFASFIAWRDWGFSDATVTNCFAMAALRSSDGAFLTGIMAAHTANAGRVYFPSGTPEPEDVRGEVVDLDGSIARELAEETGITLAEVPAEPRWHAVLAGPRIALIKVLQSFETAAELRARIRAHIASQPRSELAGVHVVHGPADVDPRMPPFVIAFLKHMWS